MTDVTPPPVPGASLLRYHTIDGGSVYVACDGCGAAIVHLPAEHLWPLAMSIERFPHGDADCPVKAQIEAALAAFAHGKARLT